MFDHQDRIALIACLFAIVFLIGMYAGEAGPSDFEQHEVSK